MTNNKRDFKNIHVSALTILLQMDTFLGGLGIKSLSTSTPKEENAKSSAVNNITSPTVQSTGLPNQPAKVRTCTTFMAIMI